MSRLNILINTLNITLLVSIPLIISLVVIFIGWEVVREQEKFIYDIGSCIIIVLSSSIASLSGFAQIYRREAPGVIPKYSITGWFAIFMGWIWVIFCLGWVVFGLYSLIMLLFFRAN